MKQRNLFHSKSKKFRRVRLLALVLLAACTPVRTTPETRYLGILLNARDLGAAQLARIERTDPAVRDAIAQRGRPDFLLETGPGDVQLFWYQASALEYFRRGEEAAPSATGELSPLPNGVLNILPRDLRAGTPSPSGPLANCWTVPVADERCRTCCVGSQNCETTCTAATR